MKTKVGDELKAKLREAVRQADIWNELADMIGDILKQCRCSMSFCDPRDQQIMFTNLSDIWVAVPLSEIDIDVEELDEREEQIAAIDAFIARLEEAKIKLRKP